MEKEIKKEAKLEKETFDVWVQTQKEFMDTCMKTQKQFWEGMTDSTRKMQEGFRHACSQSGVESVLPKDAFNVYNTMVETMMNSTKAYADEATRMQEAWNHTIAKQMEVCMKMGTNIFDLCTQKKAA